MMKINRLALFIRIITLAAVISLLTAGCDDGSTSGGGNRTPVSADYDIGNLTQTVDNVTAVTVTAKSGKSSGTVTIFYDGFATLPAAVGRYAVTFDVEAASGWNAASDLSAGTLTIMSLHSISFNVYFTGPTEKIVSVTKTVTNNLSKSKGGTITLGISESFANYEWYVGGTKVGTGKTITLNAANPAFVSGNNWITAVVYENAVPWSGEFTVVVTD